MEMIKKIEFSEESKELMEISHGGERGSTKEDARAAAAEWIKNLIEAGLHGRVFIDSFATVLFYPDDLSMDTRRKAAECAKKVELFQSGDAEWMVLPIYYCFYSFNYGRSRSWEDNVPFPTVEQAVEQAAWIAVQRNHYDGEPAYNLGSLSVWAEGMEGRLSGKKLEQAFKHIGYDIHIGI